MKAFRTFDLAVSFYRMSATMKMKGPLRDQFARAALSIPLNLSEGRGRATRKDQVRFFQIALGSARECQALVTIANLTDTEAWKLLDSLAGHLYKLIRNAH